MSFLVDRESNENKWLSEYISPIKQHERESQHRFKKFTLQGEKNRLNLRTSMENKEEKMLVDLKASEQSINVWISATLYSERTM